jgi:L-arabinokinase
VPSVFFYISGHGFGHASREVEVINALESLTPRYSIVIRTSTDRRLFDRTTRVPFTLIEGACDTGIVQLDSLRLDVPETIRRADAFYRGLADRVDREAGVLRDHDARLVVSDAPPLACAAAAAAGIPSVVLGNFTWDWIYEGYPEHLVGAPDLIDTICDAYRHASAGWRLPMHGGFGTTAPIVDVPFIARHARHEPAEVRRRLGLPAGQPLALSSFGGHGVADLDLGRLDCLDQVSLVITGEQNPGPLPRGVHFIEEHAIYDAGLRYEDLVRAVEVVVSKPGFGIITECLANDTPLLYTSRGRFAEYDVMVAEMPRVLRCGFIDQEALLGGRWRDALERVLRVPAPPERPATNGAEVVAGLIRDRL